MKNEYQEIYFKAAKTLNFPRHYVYKGKIMKCFRTVATNIWQVTLLDIVRNDIDRGSKPIINKLLHVL